MKIYACYSESHVPLLERHFLPSVPPDFDVVLRKIPQSCPTGTYNERGWRSTMCAKVQMILDAVQTERQPFIVSDVDVRFYDLRPDDPALCSPNDVTYSLDLPLTANTSPAYCAGLVVVRPSKRSENLMRVVLSKIPELGTEQRALYDAGLPTMQRDPSFRVGHLPPDRFWCLKHPPSRNLATHHANWILGVDSKMATLDEVWKATQG